MRRNANPIFRNMNNDMNQAMTSSVPVDVTVSTASWSGIALKTLLLVLIMIAAGLSTWFLPFPVVVGFLIFGGIASFFFVFFAMRSVKTAPVLSVLYAITQGIMYGALTFIVETYFPGVGVMALVATFGIVGVMAFLHSIKAVRATPGLIRFVFAALLMVMISSLVLFIISRVAQDLYLSYVDNYPLMVIVSAFLVVLGAIMLILDFNNAETIVQSGAPKIYEWQVSLGFLVTLVWIYLQVIRFLLVLARNRDSGIYVSKKTATTCDRFFFIVALYFVKKPLRIAYTVKIHINEVIMLIGD